MKKLYFIIAMLLSFTGMAQTVGQLRYDTVKMYKVGGSTELIIQNTTKDSTGGIFTNIGNGWGKWLKPYAISGGIVIGLDTVLVSGGGSGTPDTLFVGRGIAKDSVSPNSNRIYLDSTLYQVTQLNDSTLEFAHYDGRLDTVVITGSGGGGSGWGFNGDAITSGQFLGTTNNEPIVFKVNGIERGIIDASNTAIGSYFSAGVNNSGFGNDALLSATANTDNNTAVGAASLQVLTNGDRNVAVGYNSLSGVTAGVANTAIGAETTLSTTSSTDSAIAIGFEASAATRQLAISPHVTQIKATGITGANTVGNVLTITSSGISSFQTPSVSSPAGNYGNLQINRNSVFSTPASDSLNFNQSTSSLSIIGGISATDATNSETAISSYIKSIGDVILGDLSNNVYIQISGSNSDNVLRLYSNGGNPMELHDNVTVVGNITAHNIIGATSTQTDANFSATAGTAYVLSGNNSATRTITMPTLVEGDVFEFYNENTSANKWVSSATIYLSDNTTFTTLSDDTNYILRYVGGKLRVSN